MLSPILDLQVRGECVHGSRPRLPGASADAFLLSRASSICPQLLPSVCPWLVWWGLAIQSCHERGAQAPLLAFTQSLNILRGLPCFRFPNISCCGSLLSPMRMTCPSQRSRLFRIMASMLVDSAMSMTFRFETWSCHLMFRMVGRLCILKRSSCFINRSLTGVGRFGSCLQGKVLVASPTPCILCLLPFPSRRMYILLCFSNKTFLAEPGLSVGGNVDLVSTMFPHNEGGPPLGPRRGIPVQEDVHVPCTKNYLLLLLIFTAFKGKAVSHYPGYPVFVSGWALYRAPLSPLPSCEGE